MPAEPRPTVRRVKTYTSSQGYVYQYYFVGKRAAISQPGVTEYIFDVSSDRKTTYSVSILLGVEALQQWASAHGRSLTDAEQYGAVKLRLLQAFDEIENMMENGRRLRLHAGALEELLSGLGVD